MYILLVYVILSIRNTTRSKPFTQIPRLESSEIGPLPIKKHATSRFVLLSITMVLALSRRSMHCLLLLQIPAILCGTQPYNLCQDPPATTAKTRQPPAGFILWITSSSPR